MVVIGPCHHGLGFTLFSLGDNLGGRQDLNVIVKLLVSGFPIGDAFGDVRNVLLKLDIDRTLRAMTGGLDTDILKPFCIIIGELYWLAKIAEPVGVHRAVEIYSWDTLLVRSKYARNYFGIILVGCAFIVDHQIITLGIIRVAKNCQGRLGAFIGGMDVVYLDIDAAFQTLLEDVLLFRVIMTAPTGDQQCAQGLG